MIDREHVSRWLADYISAWKSYDRAAIGDLFSDDVEYLFHPYDEPVRGREAVVTAWLGESDHEGASERDEPGTYEATYRPVAVDGDLAVVTGESVYTHPDGSFDEAYENCFLIRFDGEGRCCEFTEYYVKRPPG